jgi:four helix bundle protein
VFDFQKLIVYSKAKEINKKVLVLINENRFDRHVNDQLKRATFSILLNIAEGSARFTYKDKRNFLVIARGSTFECVAIFDFLLDSNLITKVHYDNFYSDYEEISKMLFALIKKLEK